MDCVETSPNRGTCIDAIKVAYGDPTPGSEAWCAEFAFVLHREACRILRTPELLPRTKGAKDMLIKSINAGIRVDGYPEAGCVGYRLSSAGSTGHIFSVVAIESDTEKIWTIEGNVSNRVALRTYDAGYYQDDQKGVRFIHIEDMYRGASAEPYPLVFY